MCCYLGYVVPFMKHRQSRFSIILKGPRIFRGTWVAQLIKHWSLDFGSGHDLTVCEVKLSIGLCTDSMEPTWDSLSPSFSLSPPLQLVLFQNNKY